MQCLLMVKCAREEVAERGEKELEEMRKEARGGGEGAREGRSKTNGVVEMP